MENTQTYTATENKGTDVRHRVTEAVLVFVAILVLVAGYIQLLLPHTVLAFGSAASHYGASAGMIAVALALYAFATRGHTPVLEVDKATLDLWSGRQNSMSQSRVRTHYPKSKIRSLYVRRSKGNASDAVLYARIAGRFAPVRLLCGSKYEIEAVHADLCALAAKPETQSNVSSLSPRRVTPLVFTRMRHEAN